MWAGCSEESSSRRAGYLTTARPMTKKNKSAAQPQSYTSSACLITRVCVHDFQSDDDRITTSWMSPAKTSTVVARIVDTRF